MLTNEQNQLSYRKPAKDVGAEIGIHAQVDVTSSLLEDEDSEAVVEVGVVDQGVSALILEGERRVELKLDVARSNGVAHDVRLEVVEEVGHGPVHDVKVNNHDSGLVPRAEGHPTDGGHLKYLTGDIMFHCFSF